MDIITIISIIALGFIIRYLIILKKEHSSIRRKFKDFDRRFNSLGDKHHKLNQQYAEIDKSIQNIREQLERCEKQNIAHLSTKIEKFGIEPESVKTEPENNAKVFFMPAPDNEGVFDDRKKAGIFYRLSRFISLFLTRMNPKKPHS